jgi:hypothetical protein
MNADMFKQGMQFAKSATEADARGEYLPALNLYKKAVQYLLHVIKYDKSKAAHLTKAADGYMRRAEQLHQHLAVRPCVLRCIRWMVVFGDFSLLCVVGGGLE